MGFSATRIAAPVDQFDDAAVIGELRVSIAFRPVVPARDWVVVDVIRREPHSAGLINIIGKMNELAATHKMPSLIAHVEDSDCSLVMGVAPEIPPALVVFNPAQAKDYGEPAEVVDQFDADPARLVAWATQVGLPRLKLKELRRLAEREWIHAEEPVDELARLLRIDLLASPPYVELTGLIQLIDARFKIGDLSYKGDETRYALGRGDGYYAVWDRRNPGPPIRRYADDRDGRVASHREYQRLLFELPEDERLL